MPKYLNACGNIPQVFANKLYTQDLKSYFDHEFINKQRPAVIAIGSGSGAHETYFRDSLNLNVTAYDNNPQMAWIQRANLPEDNEKILPSDCSHVILFSAYPQGYLGAILDTYKSRGGKMLCVVVEGNLMTSMHAGFEPEARAAQDEGDYEENYETNTLLGRSIDGMLHTDFVIGGAISGLVNAPTNLCFYGMGWQHEALQRISVGYSYELMENFQKENCSLFSMFGAVDEAEDINETAQAAAGLNISRVKNAFFYTDEPDESQVVDKLLQNFGLSQSD
jgi:hypothetical protein